MKAIVSVFPAASMTSLFFESSQNQWNGTTWTGFHKTALHLHTLADPRDKSFEGYIGARGIEGIQDQHDDRRIQKDVHQNVATMMIGCRL